MKRRNFIQRSMAFFTGMVVAGKIEISVAEEVGEVAKPKKRDALAKLNGVGMSPKTLDWILTSEVSCVQWEVQIKDDSNKDLSRYLKVAVIHNGDKDRAATNFDESYHSFLRIGHRIEHQISTQLKGVGKEQKLELIVTGSKKGTSFISRRVDLNETT